MTRETQVFLEEDPFSFGFRLISTGFFVSFTEGGNPPQTLWSG